MSEEQRSLTAEQWLGTSRKKVRVAAAVQTIFLRMAPLSEGLGLLFGLSLRELLMESSFPFTMHTYSQYITASTSLLLSLSHQPFQRTLQSSHTSHGLHSVS